MIDIFNQIFQQCNSTLTSINNIVQNYNGIISLCGAAASVAGAFFGYKAYCTAKDIFKKGIQIDKDKTLQQLGLEFFINFIKSFDLFINDMSFIWESGDYSQNKAWELVAVLNKNNFITDFSYFEKHRGEIWIALSEISGQKSKKQTEEFESICIFVEKSKKLNSGINYIRNDLQRFINSASIKPTDITLEEYYDSLKNNEKRSFDDGIKLIKIVEKSINELPLSLKIEDIRKNKS